ncbi:hypothetical protein [Anaeroselena agilis]|uniref:DUF304 domain-containing protein n=1 Tax=Anaeroselena agilis TaxID=3063788 RepID=A0ABU3NV70_9FIRM|nr:hypothetical protein [Selenomonadales bacterium 4137-cl]
MASPTFDIVKKTAKGGLLIFMPLFPGTSPLSPPSSPYYYYAKKENNGHSPNRRSVGINFREMIEVRGHPRLWVFPSIVLVITGIKQGDWIRSLVFIAALLFILGWYLRKVNKVTVSTVGLEEDDGSFIPFESVIRIDRDNDYDPVIITTATGEKQRKIADRELAELAGTTLNQWAVDGKMITVTPGEAGQSLKINYAPRGKYCLYRGNLDFFVVNLSTAVVFLGYLCGLQNVSLAAMAAGVCYWLFFKFLNVFREVEMSVLGGTIILKGENLVEHRLKFGDVAAIERGIFQVKVTAKDGQVLRFPQGFVLLPELIEEFASERSSSAK